MAKLSITIAASFCAVLLVQAGDIQGRVKVVPNLTKRRVTLPAYESRGVQVAALRPDAHGIDELGRVAIYLEGPGLRPGAPLAVELKQQNRQFEPDVVIVPAGSTVSFPNADPIFHNVFSLSKVKQFDLGYYPAGQTRTMQFDKTGIVQVYCHLHPNMNAVVLVVPSAFYTRPQADGKFQFSSVPAGTYRILAWHKAIGLLEQQISVPEEGTVSAEFAIPGGLHTDKP